MPYPVQGGRARLVAKRALHVSVAELAQDHVRLELCPRACHVASVSLVLALDQLPWTNIQVFLEHRGEKRSTRNALSTIHSMKAHRFATGGPVHIRSWYAKCNRRHFGLLSMQLYPKNEWLGCNFAQTQTYYANRPAGVCRARFIVQSTQCEVHDP